MAKPNLNELRRTIQSHPNSNTSSQDDGEGVLWGVVITFILFCLILI